ncbi:MAG: adenylosuccinate lyase [Proteobacteria bacterium]|nr:adenylosuccinate lyase [Pseudomonadota bacterium]
MIERYTREGMGAIWSRRAMFESWLMVEINACLAMAELGQVPQNVAAKLAKTADFDVHRIDEIEQVTRHDVIAFLEAVAEKVGPDARYLHLGLTSSDVLDTASAWRLTRAADLLLADLDGLLAAVKTRAFEHKRTPCIGRSHGIHAEPTTFGLKLAVYYDEFVRHRERLVEARQGIAVGKISGAVGTFARVDPFVEKFVCERMGLEPAKASTQILQRDRHAHFFMTLAGVAASIEKLAVEIRHLQRTEVLEVEEAFAKGQKGSSAMPHKRNPVGAENVTGLARLVRANAWAALENVALWHERDISHSSVERVIMPDSTILLDYMLARMRTIVANMVVYPENMRRNLDRLRGLIYSGQVLVSLVEAGLDRATAYALVQGPAMRVWESIQAGRNDGPSFLDLLRAEPEVVERLGEADLEAMFDLDAQLTRVDFIFDRVFREDLVDITDEKTKGTSDRLEKDRKPGRVIRVGAGRGKKKSEEDK